MSRQRINLKVRQLNVDVPLPSPPSVSVDSVMLTCLNYSKDNTDPFQQLFVTHIQSFNRSISQLDFNFSVLLSEGMQGRDDCIDEKVGSVLMDLGYTNTRSHDNYVME